MARPFPFSLMLALPATLLLAGCTVGPDYKHPESAGASGDWIEPATPGDLAIGWWQRFDDPLLARLIDEAIAGSPAAREAMARVREARAGEAAARGGALPVVQASGTATENRMSENGALPVSSIPGFDPEYSLFDLGFDASWEIDLWGHQHRQIEAAKARTEAADAGRRDALLMLAGEMARAYIEMRQAQADAASAHTVADADMELARLTTLRTKAGESAPMERDRANAAARQSEDKAIQAEVRARAAAYVVARLAGRPPEALIPELTAPAPIPAAPDSIVTGLRSELLRRRPDVVRAERELAAATADVGVATADLFPRFSLVGDIGQQARSTDDLSDGGSTRFSIGPSFSWPIFTGGQVRARLRAADARAEASVARYDQAVATALSDSESAINRFLKARSRVQAAAAALEQERAAFALSRQRVERGEDDRLALARARKLLASAELADQAARAEQALAAAALFKALGGGLPA